MLYINVYRSSIYIDTAGSISLKILLTFDIYLSQSIDEFKLIYGAQVFLQINLMTGRPVTLTGVGGASYSGNRTCEARNMFKVSYFYVPTLDVCLTVLGQ